MDPRAARPPLGPDLAGTPGEATADDVASWLDALVEAAQREGAAFEARAELEHRRNFFFEPGRGQSIGEGRTGGLAVRVYVGDASGFATTNRPTRASARALVERAAAMARANAARGGAGYGFNPGAVRRQKYDPQLRADPRHADPDEVFALLGRAARAVQDAQADTLAASRFGYQDRRVLVADSAGSWVDTTFFLCSLAAHATYKGGPRIANGGAIRSGERGLLDFEGDGGLAAMGQEAAQRAKEQAHAELAPAGRQRVLTDSVLSGFLAHESFGHLTEFDLVDQHWSVLRGRRGQSFAPESVSIVDSPEVPFAPRTGVQVPFDDEGTPGNTVRILDRGVLKSYLHQRGTAAQDGQAPTGNGRALSVRHPTIVRMRNTYFEPGDLSLDEALEMLGDGVYLGGAIGGTPESGGSFMFTATHGYRVEGGEIVAPVRSASISGNVLDFLRGVEGLTRDVSVISDVWAGCSKWDQGYLPVGMGGPHVLVSEALVGGEDARAAGAGGPA